ncbi:hypothetical protein HK101_000204 [Irineochytrium annulatum]|nr:hypothetical protein HK101_000204 [Irineochytrium annulatum]
MSVLFQDQPPEESLNFGGYNQYDQQHQQHGYQPPGGLGGPGPRPPGQQGQGHGYAYTQPYGGGPGQGYAAPNQAGSKGVIMGGMGSRGCRGTDTEDHRGFKDKECKDSRCMGSNKGMVDKEQAKDLRLVGRRRSRRGELEINFEHIVRKALVVLNPLRPVERNIMEDTDLAGPLIFCFLFGSFLLFSRGVYFGYVYGFALLGWLSIYTILNLMSESGVDVYRTASVLGYCLLPMVILSAVGVGLQAFSGHLVLYFLSLLSVFWCTNASSVMFVTVLQMSEQRLLVAYPLFLFYSAFASLATFSSK